MSIERFIERRSLERGKTLAVFALLGVVILQPIWLTTVHKQRERFVILNGPGSYSVAPALAFEEAADLQEDCGAQAARAVFSRHPDGVDRPVELERWFLSDPNSGGGQSALGKVRALIAAEAREFQVKQFHQKLNITEPVSVVVLGPKAAKVTVSGQLIRVGLLQGRTHVETRKVSFQMTLARNPNMMLNHRPPLAVWDFDYGLQ